MKNVDLFLNFDLHHVLCCFAVLFISHNMKNASSLLGRCFYQRDLSLAIPKNSEAVQSYYTYKLWSDLAQLSIQIVDQISLAILKNSGKLCLAIPTNSGTILVLLLLKIVERLCLAIHTNNEATQYFSLQIVEQFQLVKFN